MGYNAIDIINKCIYIEENKEKKIMNSIKDDKISLRLKIIINVFVKDIERIINYYTELKSTIQELDLEEIDIRTYDKISFLLNEYNMRTDWIIAENISANNYLQTFVELAKDQHSLFVDLQGRLYNNVKNNKSKTYAILSNMIEYTKNHVSMLEKTMHKSQLHSA